MPPPAVRPHTDSRRSSRSGGWPHRFGRSRVQRPSPATFEGSRRPPSRSSERASTPATHLPFSPVMCHRWEEQRLCQAPPSKACVPINQDRLRKMADHRVRAYKALVYLTLLDLCSETASQISPLSKVPRTRIYATMQQLHEKGLVQILPETPLRYKAVPFATYLQTLADDMRSRAKQIDTGLAGLAREFGINAQREPESRGRFEAIYGRKNVRERLLKMYDGATREVIGIGTTKSPGRILGAFMPNLVDKAKQGVRLKYAFCFTPDNRGDVTALLKIAEVRHIDFMMPVYMHVFDGKEFLMSHPIPDDDSSYRGDDIAIWTDDPAIADAMSEMAERIWEMGKPAADVLEEGREAKRVAVTRP